MGCGVLIMLQIVWQRASSNSAALTVSLQMKRHVLHHIHLTSLCDMNDKVRPGQGMHVLPHQYLCA